MLRDVLLGLLGFSGTILEINDDTMKVRNDFDMLSIGERDQVNKLAPLGWYYLKLKAYTRNCGVRWDNNNIDKCVASGQTAPFQLYLTSMCKGVENLLHEYADDITYLDLLVENEGPLPLSQIINHLQKYLYCLPAVYKICFELKDKNVRGCQILDYLARHRSGYPYINEVVNVMLRHVRAVFLKQCMGWVLYADLDDIGQEFFVQARQTPGGTEGKADTLDDFHEHLTGRGRAAELESKFERIFSGTMKSAAHGAWVSSDVGFGDSPRASDGCLPPEAGATAGLEEGKIPFDWSSTYSLRLDFIPESHMTSRLASKVLLAGKAVKMLQAIRGSSGATNEQEQEKGRRMDFRGINDTYRYLAGVRGTKYQVQEGKGAGESARRVSPEEASWEEEGVGLIMDHVQSGGYSAEEVEHFVAGFYTVLRQDELHVEVLEQLVEEVHSAASTKLWHTLKNVYGFSNFLNIIRNTYLMGKGELYQLLLDGISAQTHVPVQDTRRANLTLDGQVLSSASYVLGLDTEEMTDIFRLRVNGYKMHVTAASVYKQSLSGGGNGRVDDTCGVVLAGAATILSPSASAAALSGAMYSADSGKEQKKLEQGELEGMVRSIKEGFRKLSQHSPGEEAEGDADAPTTANMQRLHTGSGARFSLCKMKSSPPRDVFTALFRQKILLKASAVGERSEGATDSGERASGGDVDNGRDYCRGAVWLSEPKGLAKGFRMALTFDFDWNLARSKLSSGHPFLLWANYYRGGGQDGEDPDWSVSSVSGPTWASSSPSSSALPGDRPRTPKELLQRSLALGCVTHTFHSARQGSGVVGATELGLDVPYSVSAGVSVHATIALGNGVQYFLRVFVAASTDKGPRKTPIRGSYTVPLEASTSNVEILAESLLGVDKSDIPGSTALFSGFVSSLRELQLHTEYIREVATGTGVGVGAGSGASVASFQSEGTLSTLRSLAGGGSAPMAGSVYYTLKVSVSTSDTAGVESPSKAFDQGPMTPGTLYRSTPLKNPTASPRKWQLECKLDMAHYVRLKGGEAMAGVTAAGLRFSNDTSSSASFGVYASELRFEARNKVAVSACPYTISRYPETHVRLDQELSQLRSWLNIQLRVRFPPIFHIIFDAEALSAYQRLFTLLMKIRLMAHSLEKLWKTRSRLSSDRSFCQLRHSMHFFISNLLYYLQVDVVDSEYAKLMRDLDEAEEFQQVLRAHRNFLATVLKAALVDNLTVQDAIDRVLQACLRFVAVCRLLLQQEGVDGAALDDEYTHFNQGVLSPSKVSTSPLLPVVVPNEEVEAVRKDFFSQIVYLQTVMGKVENRGFMFRLDFNNYFSGLAQGVHY